MSNNLEFWRNFWEGQSSPLHRHNTEEWYARYAQEINLILDALGYNNGSVLETGCGDGALFGSLHINKEDYVGTDISNSLIDEFKNKYPQAKLVCTDSASYNSGSKFSLIFSNGVIQYFDRQQLNLYVENSLTMLEENGILLMVNIPDRDARHKFYPPDKYSFTNRTFQLFKTSLSKLSGRPTIGSWYNADDFCKYLNSDIELHIFGSLFHPYRFSLALKKVS
jgi:cyclopropane fatty-acyl-phospholipid synthase-like methyltransferase